MTEQMDDPKEAVLASARKPSAVTNLDEMTAVVTAVVTSNERKSSSSRLRREEDKLKKSSRDEKPQVSSKLGRVGVPPGVSSSNLSSRFKLECEFQ